MTKGGVAPSLVLSLKDNPGEASFLLYPASSSDAHTFNYPPAITFNHAIHYINYQCSSWKCSKSPTTKPEPNGSDSEAPSPLPLESRSSDSPTEPESSTPVQPESSSSSNITTPIEPSPPQPTPSPQGDPQSSQQPSTPPPPSSSQQPNPSSTSSPSSPQPPPQPAALDEPSSSSSPPPPAQLEQPSSSSEPPVSPPPPASAASHSTTTQSLPPPGILAGTENRAESPQPKQLLNTVAGRISRNSQASKTSSRPSSASSRMAPRNFGELTDMALTSHARVSQATKGRSAPNSPSPAAPRSTATSPRPKGKDQNDPNFWGSSWRDFIRRIVRSKKFERLIVIIIIVNCVFLASFDPLAEPDSFSNQVLETSEIVFQTIFAIEMSFKIIGLGLYSNPGAYLRDSWNVMDGSIVILGFVSMFGNSDTNLSALRTFRLLRPLRLITAFKGMRVLVRALLSAVPNLLNVALLMAFFFLIFGIIAVELFMGVLHQRCYDDDTGRLVEDVDRLCTLGEDAAQNGAYTCEAGQTCRAEATAPNFGYLSFDHMGVAILAIFQSLTQEGWSDIMYYLQDAYSPNVWIYFLGIIVFGSFFMINLTLAVLHSSVAASEDAELTGSASGQLPPPPPPHSASTSSLKREFSRPPRAPSSASTTAVSSYTRSPVQDLAPGLADARVASGSPVSPSGRSRTLHKGTEATTSHSSVRRLQRNAGSMSRSTSRRSLARSSSKINVSKAHVSMTKQPPPLESVATSVDTSAPGLKKGTASTRSMVTIAAVTTKQKIVDFCADIVDRPWFWKTIISLIILNTLLMATEMYPMQEWHALTLEIVNYVMVIIFALEAILKLIGLGVSNYFSDRFNIFDFIVVVLSIFDLAAGNSSFVALRAFRLLRVLKLARHWVSLRNLITTILQSGAQMGSLLILLFLFIFICSLIGMQLFGGRFDFDGEETPRANFDTLGTSLVTVFQILTGEDWNLIMYDGMRASHPIAALYFVLVFIIGDYFLLNIFLAILIQNFESSSEEEAHISGTRSVTPAVTMGASASKTSLAPSITVSSSYPANKEKLTHQISQEITADLLETIVRESAADLIVDEAIKGKRTLKTAEEQGYPSGSALALPGAALSSSASLAASVGEMPLSDVEASKSPKTLIDVPGVADAVRTDLGITDEGDDDPVGLGTRTIDETAAIAIAAAAEARASKTSLPPGAQALTPPSSPPSHSQSKAMHPIKAATWDRVASPAQYDGDGDRVVIDASKKLRLKVLYSRSLGLFSVESKFRRFIQSIVEHPWFDNLIMLIIMASSITLAYDNPHQDKSETETTVLLVLDWIFTGIFMVEVLLKVITYGFVAHRHSYLRSVWNVLDFVVVVSSFAALVFTSGGQWSLIRALRMLRFLRPLRVISRYEGMRIVVNSIFQSIPAIRDVMFISLLFWLIFGILGVQLFAGRFYSCNDVTILSETDCVGQYYDIDTASIADRVWSQPPYSFDNIFSAALVLFEMATLEGWVQIMHSGVDVTTVGRAPSRNASPSNSIFFVAFIAFGSYFVINLLVGAVVNNFHMMKERFHRSPFVSKSQRERLARVMAFASPRHRVVQPRNKLRKFLFKLTTAHHFEYFIMACIIINVGFMSAQWYGQDEAWVAVLDIINDTFTWIFALEAVLKIIALGPRSYFREAWNRFDFLIVVGSLVGIVFDVGVSANVLRFFRILRIFRLVEKAERIRQLLKTLWVSLASILNVGSLLLLLFFIYTVIGVELFGGVVLGENLNVNANFQTFGSAMLLLFRMTTGEYWNGIMYDCMVEEPACSLADGTCGTKWAPAYFVSFIVFGTIVLVNLFIAIILENFNEEESQITPESLRQFVHAWSTYDPDATRHIPAGRLPLLLQQVEPPLGLGPNADRIHLFRRIEALNLPLHDGQIHFFETVMAMARTALGAEIPGDELRKLMMKRFPKMLPETYDTFSSLAARGTRVVTPPVGVISDGTEQKPVGTTPSKLGRRMTIGFGKREIIPVHHRSNTPEGHSEEDVVQLTAAHLYAAQMVQRSWRRYKLRKVAEEAADAELAQANHSG